MKMYLIELHELHVKIKYVKSEDEISINKPTIMYKIFYQKTAKNFFLQIGKWFFEHIGRLPVKFVNNRFDRTHCGKRSTVRVVCSFTR